MKGAADDLNGEKCFVTTESDNRIGTVVDYYSEASAEADVDWVGTDRRAVVRVEVTDDDTGNTRELVLSPAAAADLAEALTVACEAVADE